MVCILLSWALQKANLHMKLLIRLFGLERSALIGCLSPGFQRGDSQLFFEISGGAGMAAEVDAISYPPALHIPLDRKALHRSKRICANE